MLAGPWSPGQSGLGPLHVGASSQHSLVQPGLGPRGLLGGGGGEPSHVWTLLSACSGLALSLGEWGRGWRNRRVPWIWGTQMTALTLNCALASWTASLPSSLCSCVSLSLVHLLFVSWICPFLLPPSFKPTSHRGSQTDAGQPQGAGIRNCGRGF